MASKNIALKEIKLEANDYLHVVSEAQDGVIVNIALVGQIGSGRPSFVNAITGVKEDDENAARPEEKRADSEVKKFLPYSPPRNENIRFWILPSIDDETCSPNFFEYVRVPDYDVFLFFTSISCNEHLLKLAKKIKNRNKPVFFVRITERDTLWYEFSYILMLEDISSSKLHRVDIHQQEEYDFYKLMKAIVNVLPSGKKECFSQIPKIQELFAMHHFNKFVKEKNAKKIMPSRDEIKQLLASSGIMGMQNMMNERLQRWKDVEINLATLGNSGAGKSSFINAIRGLKSSDPLGAKTGPTETTKVPLSYQHPTNANILFWDLPGIGTPSHPEFIKFCEEIKIEIYDTFLIIASESFTESHRQFAEKVTAMGKPFFFIRSKIDQAIEGERHDYPETFEEKKVMKNVREDCVENVKNIKKEDIFLISNHHPNKWDFDDLRKAIFDRLPSSMRESLILSLQACSVNILCAKIEVLKERRFLASFASVMTKLSLGPFSLSIDKKRIMKKIHFYRLQLGFPETDSEEYQKLPEELQARVQRFDLEKVKEGSGQDFLEWMRLFDSSNNYNIKICGPLILTKKPFKFVELFLDQVLDEMEGTAKAIIDHGTAN
ncbi:interferon-inducible GTPase 1-like [Dendronephthya gigantea]|uniref:interferon-inducible GTPase 1-like n=1 Tax=Dendronephthya gigantea TaxID=151771 RepID=UPI00106BF4FB|nr:interferon-inducible GTPase 1-like [Dendronephthya gigantea]